LRRRRGASDAVKLLHVLADLFGYGVRIDQLITGRNAEEGCVLIATLQRRRLPQRATALGDAEHDAVIGDAGRAFDAWGRRFARRPFVAAFAGDFATASRTRVFCAEGGPCGFERLWRVGVFDADCDADDLLRWRLRDGGGRRGGRGWRSGCL